MYGRLCRYEQAMVDVEIRRVTLSRELLQSTHQLTRATGLVVAGREKGDDESQRRSLQIQDDFSFFFFRSIERWEIRSDCKLEGISCEKSKS